MDAVPLMMVQEPLPKAGLLAAMVKEEVLHKVWSGPAAATGAPSCWIVISSVDAGHAPLEIVQRSVILVPAATPVMDVVGEDGVVIVAVPLTTDQSPLPIAGLLAAMLNVVVLHKV